MEGQNSRWRTCLEGDRQYLYEKHWPTKLSLKSCIQLFVSWLGAQQILATFLLSEALFTTVERKGKRSFSRGVADSNETYFDKVEHMGGK